MLKHVATIVDYFHPISSMKSISTLTVHSESDGGRLLTAIFLMRCWMQPENALGAIANMLARFLTKCSKPIVCSCLNEKHEYSFPALHFLGSTSRPPKYKVD